MSKRKMTDIGLLIALLWFCVPQSAHAYLDPGTGSYVIQVLVASVLGGLFAVKSFWGTLKYKVASLFSKGKSEKTTEG